MAGCHVFVPMFCGVQLFLHPGPATAIVVKKAATGVAGEVRAEGAAVGVVDGDVFLETGP